MEQVCHQENLPMSAVRFIYDGIRISIDSTPEQVKKNFCPLLSLKFCYCCGHLNGPDKLLYICIPVL